MDNLIRCDEIHLPALSGLYGRAFLNDPLYRYIFPEAAQREALIAWELGQVAHYGLLFGEGYATPAFTGAAICLPPGETDFTEARMAEVGMLDAAYAIKAVRAASHNVQTDKPDHLECAWQRTQLPGKIRDLVLDDQKLRNAICWSVFDC